MQGKQPFLCSSILTSYLTNWSLSNRVYFSVWTLRLYTFAFNVILQRSENSKYWLSLAGMLTWYLSVPTELSEGLKLLLAGVLRLICLATCWQVVETHTSWVSWLSGLSHLTALTGCWLCNSISNTLFIFFWGSAS